MARISKKALAASQAELASGSVTASQEYTPGQQIAQLRILRGLTQAQLAEIVGSRQSYIARLENGSSIPSLSFLDCIAKSLDACVELRLIPRN